MTKDYEGNMDIVYERMVLGDTEREYFNSEEQAIKRMTQSFWAGTSARGIVFNFATEDAFVVVDSPKYDKYRTEWNIKEIND